MRHFHNVGVALARLPVIMPGQIPSMLNQIVYIKLKQAHYSLNNRNNRSQFHRSNKHNTYLSFQGLNI